MLIGILSDSHGRTSALAAALRVLQDAGAAYLIHCGDVGERESLDLLAGLPVAFVWGNTDWNSRYLESYAKDLGIRSMGRHGELSLGGKQIAVMHGDDLVLKKRILDGQRHDYLFVGHSHQVADERVGRTRIINPGALHRVAQRTVALLDLERDELRVLPVHIQMR
jgi:putative phosphoesterase